MQIDPKILDLMNRGLDNALSPSELRQLELSLEKDHEIADYYRHLQQMAKSLSASGNAEPPAELKTNIMQSLPERVPAPVRSHLPQSRLAQWWKTRLMAERGIPMAAGIAIGAVVMAIVLVSTLYRPISDQLNLTGTILPVAADDFNQVASGQIGTPTRGVSGKALRHNDRVLIDLEVTVPDAETLQVSHDPGQFVLLGFTREGGDKESPRSGPGDFSIEVQGHCRIDLLLKQNSEVDRNQIVHVRLSGRTDEYLELATEKRSPSR